MVFRWTEKSDFCERQSDRRNLYSEPYMEKKNVRPEKRGFPRPGNDTTKRKKSVWGICQRGRQNYDKEKKKKTISQRSRSQWMVGGGLQWRSRRNTERRRVPKTKRHWERKRCQKTRGRGAYKPGRWDAGRSAEKKQGAVVSPLKKLPIWKKGKNLCQKKKKGDRGE